MTAAHQPFVPRMRRLAGIVVAAACLFAAALVSTAQARAGQSPDAALTELLDQARAEAPGACAQPDADHLLRVLCAGRLRVGVREYYPLFGIRTGSVRSGYEIDVGRAIAERLHVDVEFTKVNAASRIPLLADDRIDLIVATMGHNVQRDGQVRFIRPHYYQSETAVIGARDLSVAGWPDLIGRTVCVSVGNSSNAELVSHGARLMLFDEAATLPERLDDRTCTLAAQDNSFFASYFTGPHFSATYAEKFGFGELPWGMAVARTGSDRLARALDLMSQIFHRDGVFLSVARANRIGTGFLERQNIVWRKPECDTDTGSTNPDCVLPPFDAEFAPTAFAGPVEGFERWFSGLTGYELLLPMLKTAPAWSLFQNGVVNSLVLIAGALAATLVMAMAFGAALGSSSPLLRWGARAVTVALQSSPIVLTLVITASVMHSLFVYSSAVALGSAIVALGLANGSNAGQAIAEALATLRTERAAAPIGGMDLFSRAVSRSASQIVAFLINAAKGTPIASFIGAPELLSALTDITSFSSGRATTYTLLLIFYIAVVMAVVWLCHRFQAFLERRHAAA